jgi:transcriptional regulator with XRE-family HTH domain
MRRSGRSDIDRFVALRIKELRLLAGMTQQQLASQLGISGQQMHKFETGIDRLPAGRLLAIARAFDVAVADLFEGYRGTAPEPFVDPKTTQMLRNVTDAFLELEPKQQDALTRLARALARSTADRADAARSKKAPQ